MDIGSLIIGLILLGCFIGPIFYYNWLQKKRSHTMLKKFLETGNSLGLQLNEFETWGGAYCIGIDKNLKRLFYMKKRQNVSEKEILIDLHDLSSSTIFNASRPVKAETVGENTVLDLLELNLRLGSTGKEESIEFYSRNENPVRKKEWELIQKWDSIVSGYISS